MGKNDVAMRLFDEMFACAKDAKSYGATGDDMSIALITLVANACGHACPTEPQQDAYLNWFVACVEGVLKGAGARTTARPNPLAPTGSSN